MFLLIYSLNFGFRQGDERQVFRFVEVMEIFTRRNQNNYLQLCPQMMSIEYRDDAANAEWKRHDVSSKRGNVRRRAFDIDLVVTALPLAGNEYPLKIATTFK
jgi:hypothetical protein